MSRLATIDRETKETRIEIELNLDGSGTARHPAPLLGR